MGRLARLCGMPGAAFPASVLCGSVRLAVDVHRPPRRVPTEARRPRALSGTFGEISNGKLVCVFSRHRPVSSMYSSNELMRRCLLR
jgi:hypothetical protein